MYHQRYIISSELVETPDLSSSFNPFRLISIGKRSDLMEGFSSFEIADFLVWDKAVYGMPFQSLGKDFNFHTSINFC